jgi:NAD(P)H-nitrite reductase large subunit
MPKETPHMHYVVLGAGPAGVTAAETLRQHDRNAQITMIGAEPEKAPYSRMAIPYLLDGRIGEHGTHLRQDDEHFTKLGITYGVGRATGIDTKAKRIALEGGSGLAYDRLLIATGASPIIPRMEGASQPGVHTCWTLSDARELLKHAHKGQSVVLVGAGFIGCIVLEALHARGCDLTVVELAPRMVARMMDETAGGMLTRWCREHGVKVFTGTKVEMILPGSGRGSSRFAVHLSDGSAVNAGLVVLAAGVRSNIGFLAGSGIETGNGIKVDQFLRTTAPDVYAAGDCCEGFDLSTGKPEMLAIQPVAVEHGRIAGQNMAGVATPHRGSLNMNVLDTMGLISSSFGLWQGAERGYTGKVIDQDKFKYLKLEFDGDRMVGAQCVGMTDHVGMLRGLIQTGFRLGSWRDKLMAAPERLREAYISVAQGAPSFGPTGPHVKTPVV